MFKEKIDEKMAKRDIVIQKIQKNHEIVEEKSFRDFKGQVNNTRKKSY